LSDGWFWFANLIEYEELSYQAWVKTGQSRYRDKIGARDREIEQAMEEYEFPDLRGRWHLLKGHLGIEDALSSEDHTGLPVALEHYKVGFTQIARGFVGSHGAAAIPREFERFGELFRRLPLDTQAQWQEGLRRAWREADATSLLARLGELF
jgi:hypothetical protein